MPHKVIRQDFKENKEISGGKIKNISFILKQILNKRIKYLQSTKIQYSI